MRTPREHLRPFPTYINNYYVAWPSIVGHFKVIPTLALSKVFILIQFFHYVASVPTQVLVIAALWGKIGLHLCTQRWLAINPAAPHTELKPNCKITRCKKLIVPNLYLWSRGTWSSTLINDHTLLRPQQQLSKAAIFGQTIWGEIGATPKLC